MNQVKTFFAPLLLVLLAGAAWWPVEGRKRKQPPTEAKNAPGGLGLRIKPSVVSGLHNTIARGDLTDAQRAALELGDKQNAAATKLQSAWRGRQAKQEAERLRQAEARMRLIRKDRAESDGTSPDSQPPPRRARSKRVVAVDHNRQLTDAELMSLQLYRTKATGQIVNAGRAFEGQVERKTLTFGDLNENQLQTLGYQKVNNRIVPGPQALVPAQPLPIGPLASGAGG